MGNVSAIALSGLTAAALRLEVSARNVANAFSAGPLPSAGPAIMASFPAAYAAQRVDQVETMGGGTRAIVTPSQPATIATFDPDAPYADGDGMVAMPNVDFASEAIEQLLARTSYAFNALVLRSHSQMMKLLVDITA
jgi:flagellar basal-body rod protein FlgC